MNVGRFDFTATTLQDLTILVVGGVGAEASATAELYDSSGGAFTMTGALNDARYGHQAVLLNDGRVLIVGGQSYPSAAALASTEIYDPSNGHFTTTGAMHFARFAFSATLLNDGRVLAAGGANADPSAPASAEADDPGSGIWSDVGMLNEPRWGHSAVALSNGKVLVTGGTNGSSALKSAELFDPSTNTFTNTKGSLITGRHAHASLAISGGKVLIIGGSGGAAGGNLLKSAEVYNPITQKFKKTGSMSEAREDFVIAPITGGLVLGGDPDNSAQVYAKKKFQTVGTTSGARVCGAAASTTTASSGLSLECN